MPAPVRHLNAVESGVDAISRAPCRKIEIGQRQLDVLEDAQVADQVEALKDEADLLQTDARALGRGQPCDRAAVKRIRALRRRVEQAENGQQRGFATPRGALD